MIYLTTKVRIACARILYALTRLVVRPGIKIITRGGIKYEVDLAEGSDLSLFLFGSFQKHVTNNSWTNLPGEATVIDVGANFGIMTLQFAQSCPDGKVYAFEPTYYAIKRIRRNLVLNPKIAERIEIIQSFVAARSQTTSNLVAYASWRLDGLKNGHEHPVHLGTPHSTYGIPSTTLEEFVSSRNLTRLDLIKIDVDGDEFMVLQGAQAVIKRFNPLIIFEIGLYCMSERGIDFADFEKFFKNLGYHLYDTKTNCIVNLENYKSIIPLNATTDLAAVPGK
jgi:FkbM family methyltransferase